MTYETPIAAVLFFCAEDILTTSSGGENSAIPDFKDENVHENGWL